MVYILFCHTIIAKEKFIQGQFFARKSNTFIQKAMQWNEWKKKKKKWSTYNAIIYILEAIADKVLMKNPDSYDKEKEREREREKTKFVI